MPRSFLKPAQNKSWGLQTCKEEFVSNQTYPFEQKLLPEKFKGTSCQLNVLAVCSNLLIPTQILFLLTISTTANSLNLKAITNL